MVDILAFLLHTRITIYLIIFHRLVLEITECSIPFRAARCHNFRVKVKKGGGERAAPCSCTRALAGSYSFVVR